ncbi:FdhF/YdeP family oxidoreductase [Polycladidibacter hongkongensis]|uniref:FdhF/YdeP family oxidoreductase n=1 Tax=Polycladidibacter hongkongensis TaxID=1647556 RepID=UPI00082B4EF2|nr:FdhF/YdeP family oxidoreductase [Pseudovibrio hongkongensis]
MPNKPPFKPSSAAAGGWGALKASGESLLKNTGLVKGVKTMLKANKPDGFDCPGCAWGDPEHGSSFEFCENGVKAVTWEATKDVVPASLFERHSMDDLRKLSDRELESMGRLTKPLRYSHKVGLYEEVSWDAAFAEIAGELNALPSADNAAFYTSGRASNEAAFLYQLMGRLYGTNNFPDCSNMCHEASGVALSAAIGVGKGTVTLDDFDKAEVIFVLGQNPGSNHPRMLAELKKAIKRGAKVITLNPLKERGLERFTDPKNSSEMLLGLSTPISSHYLNVKLGGDMAVMRGIAKALLTWDYENVLSGTVLRQFIDEHCENFQSYESAVERSTWKEIEDQSGLSQRKIEEIARIYAQSNRVIFCWAMGITQHEHSVDTIREITNVALLRGNVGKAGAGLCPVRGHSNVQGDRTMGINERPSPAFLRTLGSVFDFSPPRKQGINTVETIASMLAGNVKALVCLGGNFARATPDTEQVEEALGKLRLTVNIATKLNRSHLITGEKAFILPCLGRTEFDEQLGGRQLVSVEDSMSMVHGSAGINQPISKELRSEPAIIAGIAKHLVGSDKVNWDGLIGDYDEIRKLIEKVVPGFHEFNARLRQNRGFYLGNAAREREWVTPNKRANFSYASLPLQTVVQRCDKAEVPTFTLQTLRSHDQYNTTVYSDNDRYRGIKGNRRVLFICEADLRKAGFKNGARVDIMTVSEDKRQRVAYDFTLVAYDSPQGCLAAYYPETNVLVPLYSVGVESHTPTSKAIPVTLRRTVA